ncbi:AP-3 complex subunit delta-1 [Physocladia obscura]|uniref:AP-3 complex subunit delta n=1 Tax=Physocladia obscura TaxID=109957 RepID=A0AAD5XFM0_9FUNG|nr:AP-3 complex subunit delta-1 [Physocladia obscura]
MFEKSLHDVIRGIRANAANEDRYIRSCLDEIRAEVKRTDPAVKAVAVAKLFYLHMLGYDMAWAAFHVIEVMSSPVLAHKRIGYIAAAISFRQDTNVLMLCTNLIRKDLNSNNYLETALALNGLCTIVTPDLARDLSPDLIANMNHSRPYIRKRVILCLYKVFLKFPEALRVAVPRLKERLEDPDPSVVSAAVNVVCELARKNPKSYLPLAPQLFTILTTSTNNWLLIKIVKLFGALCPLEPRLIKRLISPITNLIQTTGAMSLAYECILTAIMGGMIVPATNEGVGSISDATLKDGGEAVLAKICVAKLKFFIADSDQNLKYLGLFALCKLLPLRPHAVGEHREIILACLEDKDISIRMRALELISSMVTKRNLMAIVNHLMKQLSPESEADLVAEHHQPTSASLAILHDATYASEVISRILQFCSKNTYGCVTDFEWYVRVLVGFVWVRGASVGLEVAEQIVDVCVRVEGVREAAVDILTDLILDESFLESTAWEKNNTDVLFAAAWVVGEYSMFVATPKALIFHLISSKISMLPVTVQAAYIQASLKIYSAWLSGQTSNQTDNSVEISKDEFDEMTQIMMEGMLKLCGSADLEVQERASTSYQILSLISSLSQDNSSSPKSWGVPSYASELSQLFAGELRPVNSQAQSLVPVPEDLDLDAWIHDPEPDLANINDESEEAEEDYEDNESLFSAKKKAELWSPEAVAKAKKAMEVRRKMDPFYIAKPLPQAPSKILSETGPFRSSSTTSSTVNIPESSAKKGTAKKASSKSKSPFENADIFNVPTIARTQYKINRDDELPEGATARQPSLSSSVIGSSKKKGNAKADAVGDADTLAIKSVDLTAAAPAASVGAARKLGWEIDRAALLAEETPALGVGVEVVRKIKKVGVGKKTAAAVVTTSGAAVAAVTSVVDGGLKKKKKVVTKSADAGTSNNAIGKGDDMTDEKEPSAAVKKVVKKVVVKKKKAGGAALNTRKVEDVTTVIADAVAVSNNTAQISGDNSATAVVSQQILADLTLENALDQSQFEQGLEEKGVQRIESPLNSLIDERTVIEDTEAGPAILYQSIDAQEIASSHTFHTCLENDDVVFGFDCYSQGQISISELGVAICLVIFNKSETAAIENAAFTLLTSGVHALDGTSMLHVQDGRIAPNEFGKVLMQAKISSPSVEYGMKSHTIEGACVAELGGDSRMYPFSILIPITMGLIPSFTIAPTMFAELLSHSNNFPHSSSIQFQISSVDDFPAVVSTLAAKLRLSVVEAVPLAASVYGRAWSGTHVAGLIKARVKEQKVGGLMKMKSVGSGIGGANGNSNNSGWISVELKSGDLALIDYLIAEANEFSLAIY